MQTDTQNTLTRYTYPHGFVQPVKTKLSTQVVLKSEY